jgi:hypothetical protein
LIAALLIFSTTPAHALWGLCKVAKGGAAAGSPAALALQTELAISAIQATPDAASLMRNSAYLGSDSGFRLLEYGPQTIYINDVTGIGLLRRGVRRPIGHLNRGLPPEAQISTDAIAQAVVEKAHPRVYNTVVWAPTPLQIPARLGQEMWREGGNEAAFWLGMTAIVVLGPPIALSLDSPPPPPPPPSDKAATEPKSASRAFLGTPP